MFKMYPLSKCPVYSTIILTIGTLLYIASPECIHLGRFRSKGNGKMLDFLIVIGSIWLIECYKTWKKICCLELHSGFNMVTSSGLGVQAM